MRASECGMPSERDQHRVDTGVTNRLQVEIMKHMGATGDEAILRWIETHSANFRRLIEADNDRYAALLAEGKRDEVLDELQRKLEVTLH